MSFTESSGRLHSTMQEYELCVNAVVWLEPEDVFSADRDVLIALRESCMKILSSKQLATWRVSRRLGSFTSPKQLATCHGMNVHSGRVTELKLIRCVLIGTFDACDCPI